MDMDMARNRSAKLEKSDTHPAIVVEGVAVHAYFKDGKFIISVHTDTGEAPQELFTLPGGGLPMEFSINGYELWSND